MFLRRISALALALFLILTLSLSVRAEELRYYMGDQPLNASKDSGYTGTDPIGPDDIHYGWTLGRFYVTGYTRGPDSLEGGTPVFLKNAGDTVALWFRLDQDIHALNGDTALTVADDDVGFDGHFGTAKTDFGRGTLIVRHTDHQNQPGEPVIYIDYLSALTAGAEVQVELFEEGDYEVALDYSVKYAPLSIMNTEIFPRVEDYRIFFRFSVRNGNCMVFPFDLGTGAELTNMASTDSGFSLDLARSRYLDIQVKRTVMADSPEGPVADIRFNRPARDGEQYTQEGIYTITVTNRYTYEQTEKVIYVGTRDNLISYADSGLFPEELTMQLSAAAGIAPGPADLLSDLPMTAIVLAGAGIAVLIAVVLLVRAIRKRRDRSLLDYDGKRWWG